MVCWLTRGRVKAVNLEPAPEMTGQLSPYVAVHPGRVNSHLSIDRGPVL